MTYKWINALEAVSGSKAKDKIIADAWAAKDYNFFKAFKMAYDPFITYGVKKVPLIEGENEPGFVPTFTWDDFISLTDKLAKRELTGHAARDALNEAAERADANEWNILYRRVILRDMRCGTTDSKINDFLESIEATDAEASKYKIFIFSCQLAKPSEDHPKKMVGEKLCDYKFDGARLLTILNKEEGTVRQFSRNGKENFNFTKITSELAKLLPEISASLVLDGEIVASNFQTLMTKFSKDAKVTDDSAHLALFDVIPLADFVKGFCNIPQETRHSYLSQMAGNLQQIGGTSFVVPKLRVNLDTPEGRKSYLEFNREAIEAGYEGIMIKDPKAPYECKRSAAWLKQKPVISVSLTLKDINPGEPGTKYEHSTGALVFEGYGDGQDSDKFIEVNVGSGLSDKDRLEFWENRATLLGMIYEIEADAITKDRHEDTSYSLRFPRLKGLRGTVPGEKI